MPAPENRPLQVPFGLPESPAIQPLLLKWSHLFSSVEELHHLPESLTVLIHRKRTEVATAEEHAELYLIQAETARQNHRYPEALQAVDHALELLPAQWLGFHIRLLVLEQMQAYEEARNLIDRLIAEPPGDIPSWDHAPTTEGLLLHRARLCCLQSRWEEAQKTLNRCFPDMVNAPQDVLRHWFILALYTDDRHEAFQAAYRLIHGTALDAADALLQVLVLRGWLDEALNLYETLYRQHPDHLLLRRRLIALNIRLERLEEARELARKGSIFHAA